MPLETDSLSIDLLFQWASSLSGSSFFEVRSLLQARTDHPFIPFLRLVGFLALICVPMPFVFFYYGERFVVSPFCQPAALRLVVEGTRTQTLWSLFLTFFHRIRGLSSFSPTGKPAPLASSLASSPTDAEKSDSTHPHRLQPMQSRPEHRVDELGQEFGEEAGMEEQRAQDLELERRRSGINVV